MYEVIDAKGRVIKLRDDQPCPDGCSLRTPMQFKDGVRRAVAREFTEEFPITDADVQRCVDARAAYVNRISRGMHRHRVSTDADDVIDRLIVKDEDVTPGRVAYDAYKKRLSGQYRARKKASSALQPWQK